MGDEPGLGVASAEWLHDREVAAVALDNWACEVWPSRVTGGNIPFHQVAIRDMGLTLGEMFNFEDLASDCEQDGVWECLFCAPGLKVTGSVGSPITPSPTKPMAAIWRGVAFSVCIPIIPWPVSGRSLGSGPIPVKAADRGYVRLRTSVPAQRSITLINEVKSSSPIP